MRDLNHDFKRLAERNRDGARYTGAGWSERVNADAEKYGLYHAFSGRYDLPVTRDFPPEVVWRASVGPGPHAPMECP